jgi:hypothetical protein
VKNSNGNPFAAAADSATMQMDDESDVVRAGFCPRGSSSSWPRIGGKPLCRRSGSPALSGFAGCVFAAPANHKQNEEMTARLANFICRHGAYVDGRSGRARLSRVGRYSLRPTMTHMTTICHAFVKIALHGLTCSLCTACCRVGGRAQRRCFRGERVALLCDLGGHR